MDVRTYSTEKETGARAAATGLQLIRGAIALRGHARIIIATGASQFSVFEALTAAIDVEWDKVTAFHLDEYCGIRSNERASFRKYLKERFVDRIAPSLHTMHYIDGEGDCEAECVRVGALLREDLIDVAFVGIGENAHLAFNDPPADFDTEEPYLIVDLDTACRQQQVNEGWFDSLEKVPKQAISMSIQQILKSRVILCTVPGERKAAAIRLSVEGPVTPDVPSSILQTHADIQLYLERQSASQLSSHSLSILHSECDNILIEELESTATTSKSKISSEYEENINSK